MIPEIFGIHPSWNQYLEPLFADEKMQMIKNDILPKAKFYPSIENVFRVFRMPLNEIKVVILGQDPYSKGEAISYSFAIDKYTSIPQSLSTIKNEIVKSDAITSKEVNIMTSDWKELKHWRRQGVFLLNAALTVQAGESNSHAG